MYEGNASYSAHAESEKRGNQPEEPMDIANTKSCNILKKKAPLELQGDKKTTENGTLQFTI